MNKLQAILIAVVLISGCKNDNPPSGILTKAEMIKTLKQVYILEQKTMQLGVSNDSAIIVFEELKNRMYKDKNTTDSVFKRSLDYYWDRPDDIRAIYTALVDSLNLGEQSKAIE